MKKLYLFTLVMAFFYQNSIIAQPTATVNIIQQPCNGNGVLAINNVTGLTPPLGFSYGSSNGHWAYHDNINRLDDTLFNIEYAIQTVTVYEMANYNNYITLNNIGVVEPFQVSTPTVTPAICPSHTGSAHVEIVNNIIPSQVEWYKIENNDTTLIGNGTPINLAPDNSHVISYKAKVFDNAGCYVWDSSVYINEQSPITYNLNTTIANCTDGTATIYNVSGGIAPYTYNWSNGAHSSTINNLIAGNYSFTITDAQGCSNTRNFYINQAITIGVNTTVTNATCVQNDGQIIGFGSGGTPPYQYIYNNGTNGQTASNLQGGQAYSLIITDSKGCIGNGSAYVGINTPINVTYAASVSLCTQATGSATLTITGGTAPYNVIWSSYPAQTGNVLNNVSPGQYSFVVTDASGCRRSGTVTIGQVSSLSISVNSVNPTCPQTTGSASVSVNGNQPPFTYSWSNGETTNSINNRPVGSYSCKVTDNLGCSVTKYASIQQLSPLSVNLNSTPASCKYNADGSIAASIVGGTSPYSYNWSNGETTSNVTNLLSGNYNVYVTDANNCVGRGYNFIDYNTGDSSCFCVLKGKVYEDVNNNCQYDIGENGIKNIMIHCSNNGYSFTNINGDYSIIVPAGSYTLSEVVQYFYPLANCQLNAIPITSNPSNSCKIYNNFANNVQAIHDVHVIRTFCTPPIPGFNYRQRFIIQNNGTIDETSILDKSRLDNQIQLNSINPTNFALVNSTSNSDLYDNASNLLALTACQNQTFVFDYQVPANIPLGTQLYFNDTVADAPPTTNWLNDYTPWNNISNYYPIVVGSYDPNMKEVSPQGIGTEGLIEEKDTVLDYVIHFQNTGTYYAQKVVVIDTLDNNLDWTTLKLGYSDHSYVAELNENGILKFTFNNIHLTWQAQSEMGSRGMVTYTINRKKNLPVGTKIAKAAGIYFDFNAPVITNRALSTIGISLLTGTNTANQNVCEGVAITDIKYAVTPTNFTITGLPSGISTSLDNDTVLISGIPNVSGSFTYSVIMGGDSSTDGIKTGTLNIDPSPQATAGGSTTICENGNTTVSGASLANGTPTWSENGNGGLSNSNGLTPTYTASASDAGSTITLIMTVTGVNTCSSQTATANYTVNIDPLPQATAGGSQTICIDSTATISGASASNGTIQWNLVNGNGNITSGANTLTPEFTPSNSNGDVLIMTVTSTNTCGSATATASYTINVDLCATGIEEFNSNKIDIYPNPINDQLYISSSKIASIKITDITGKEIYSGTIESGITSVSFNNFSSGIYFVTITDNQTSITKKIIKN